MLQSSEMAYGSLLVYSGLTPTKAATEQYTYEFKGWSPTISKVTGNVTYKATYDAKGSASANIPMQRLYNPYSYEHFYTADKDEHDGLVALGWADEGIAWYGV